MVTIRHDVNRQALPVTSTARSLTRRGIKDLPLIKASLAGIGVGCAVANFATPDAMLLDLPKLGAAFGMSARVIDNSTKVHGFIGSFEACRVAIQSGVNQQEAVLAFLDAGVACGAHLGSMVKAVLVLTGGAILVWFPLTIAVLGLPGKVSMLQKAHKEVETMRTLDLLFKKINVVQGRPSPKDVEKALSAIFSKPEAMSLKGLKRDVKKRVKSD